MAEPGSRGIAWAGAVNLIGGTTGALLGLLLAVVVGRQLGTEGAGTYFLVVAVFMIVSHVVELGADTGLVRYVAAARATGRVVDVPHLLRVALRPVLAAGVIVVVLTAVLVHADLGILDELSPRLVVVGAVLAVLSALTAVVLAVTRGLGDVVSYPLLQNVMLPLLRLGAVFAVVSSGGDVARAVVAWMLPVPVVLVVASGIAVMLMKRHVGSVRHMAEPRPGARGSWSSRGFWAFSAARGVSAAVEILLEWIDVILVGVLASPREAGIYAVVTRCARVGEVIQQAARIAVGPQISAALATGATAEARQIYGLVTSAMIWLAWPFFLVLAIFGDAVLSLFGTGFGDGATSLTILSLAMAISTSAGTVQTILLMGGRSAWQLADKSFALVLNVALDLALIPLWGIEGAAVAWAVTIVVDTGIVVHQVHGLMDLRPRGRQVGVAAALAVGVVGAPALASRLVFGSSVDTLLATVAVVGVAYVAVTWSQRQRLGLVDLVAHRPTASGRP